MEFQREIERIWGSEAAQRFLETEETNAVTFYKGVDIVHEASGWQRIFNGVVGAALVRRTLQNRFLVWGPIIWYVALIVGILVTWEYYWKSNFDSAEYNNAPPEKRREHGESTDGLDDSYKKAEPPIYMTGL